MACFWDIAVLEQINEKERFFFTKLYEQKSYHSYAMYDFTHTSTGCKRLWGNLFFRFMLRVDQEQGLLSISFYFIYLAS